MRKLFFIVLTAFILTSIMSVSAFEGEEKVFKLENGLTVILKETHVVPMVSMQAWIKAGSITEGKYTGSGLSHYFEHMLFKGTKTRGPGEIAQTIHMAGGSDLNAYTSFEKTVYHFTVLDNYTDTGLDVLSDMLMNSVFDEEEAEKELKVILNEINMSKDRPDSNFYWSMLQTAYQTFPYRYPILGHEALFRKLTREDVLWYYNMMYSPSNTVLSMVGNFEMETMMEKIEKYFGGWERKIVPPVALPEEPAQLNNRFLEMEAEVNNSRMYMVYKGVDMYHQDAFALDCLSFVLGAGETSRLYSRLVTEDRIANSVGTGSWTPQYPGLFMIRAIFDTENYTKVRFAIQDEVNRFKTEFVSDEELERVKNNVIAGKIFGDEEIDAQASSLASSYFYTGSLSYDKAYLDGISSVTKEDIMRVANKYLNTRTMSLIHMKPAKEKTQVARTDESTRKTPEVTVKTLDNGIKVILMEDHKLPIVSVNSGFFAGLLAEDEKNNGISAFAANMLPRGTEQYSKEDILKLEINTGSSIGASSGNNTIFISAKMLKDNFEKIWPVYVSILKENQFTDEDFQIEKDIRIAAIKRNMEDINHVNNLIYRRHTFKGHPYSRDTMGTEESLTNMTAEDVKAFIKRQIVPDNMTISVVGDFKTNEMMQRIEDAFASMPKTGFKQPDPVKPDQISGVKEYIENMPDKRQSVVRLSFRGVDFKSSDKHAFSVVSRILSGLGSRLFENLRSKHSLAYSVYAYPFNGLNTGAYMFYISTTPEKREFAIQKMKEEIEILKNEPVSQEELDRAINKIIGGDAGKLQSTMGMAEEFVLDEMYGLGYQEAFDYIDQIKAVTPEDIQRVARQYFDLDNCVISIVEP